MQRRPQPFVVRSCYPHRLGEACQHFVGSLLVLRPQSFLSAVRRLVEEVPVPLNLAEAAYLWTNMKNAVTRGGLAYHAWFHTALDPRPCIFIPTPVPAPSAVGLPSAAKLLLNWAQGIDAAFEKEHTWPAGVRAALLLEHKLTANWYVPDLARRVNASSATLQRSFKRVYGISVQQYQSLLRVRQAAFAVRGNEARLEGHVLDLGCRNANDVYRPLRRLTGMTLGDVRRLDDHSFQKLVEGPLSVPLAGFRQRQIR